MGSQLSSDRPQAAYDVWPVTAATMIRGIALTSAAVTASATIALKAHVSVDGEPSAALSGRSGGATGADCPDGCRGAGASESPPERSMHASGAPSLI